MPIAAWPFARSRVDPADVLRDQFDRLAALGVLLRPLAPADARSRFALFVERFIDPERAVFFLDRRADAAHAGRGLEMARWLRPDRVCQKSPVGLCRWLAAGAANARAVRFDRRAALPAIDLDLDTLADAWASSWPGVFVNFAAGRAAVVTLDYEDVRCDLRAAPATPYR